MGQLVGWANGSLVRRGTDYCLALSGTNYSPPQKQKGCGKRRTASSSPEQAAGQALLTGAAQAPPAASPAFGGRAQLRSSCLLSATPSKAAAASRAGWQATAGTHLGNHACEEAEGRRKKT